MFAIQHTHKTPETESETNKCIPNILPCRIHHDGPVDSLERYWTPSLDEQQKNVQTVYFRGRKLQGRRVAVPDGYRGVVATPTDRVVQPKSTNGADPAVDETETESEEQVKILEEQGGFDEVVVWGHEAVPAADDPFVKGVEEWVRLAEAMNSTGNTAVDGGKGAPS